MGGWGWQCPPLAPLLGIIGFMFSMVRGNPPLFSIFHFLSMLSSSKLDSLSKKVP